MTILEKAREILSDPRRWTKGALFDYREGELDENGKPIFCFCAFGALYEAVRSEPNRFTYEFDVDGYEIATPGVLLLRQAILERSTSADESATDMAWLKMYDDNPEKVITSYNDHPATSHADILRVFDRAIQLEQEEAAQ